MLKLKTPRALRRENARLIEQIRAAMRDATDTKTARMQVLDEDKGVWVDLRGPDAYQQYVETDTAPSRYEEWAQSPTGALYLAWLDETYGIRSASPRQAKDIYDIVVGDGGLHAPVPSSPLNRKQRRAAAKKARRKAK